MTKPTDDQACEQTCDAPCCNNDLRDLLAACTAYADGRMDDFVLKLVSMKPNSLRNGVIEILTLTTMTALYAGCPITDLAVILNHSINEGHRRAEMLRKTDAEVRKNAGLN